MVNIYNIVLNPLLDTEAACSLPGLSPTNIVFCWNCSSKNFACGIHGGGGHGVAGGGLAQSWDFIISPVSCNLFRSGLVGGGDSYRKIRSPMLNPGAVSCVLFLVPAICHNDKHD